jgi:hypothetical protein
MACLAVTNTNPADRLAAADLIAESLADLAPDTFERLLAR